MRILGHQLGAALGPRALSADDAAAHTLLVGLDGQQIASRNPHLVHRWRVQGCVDGHRVVETQATALLVVDVVRHCPGARRAALRHGKTGKTDGNFARARECPPLANSALSRVGGASINKKS